MLTSLSTREGLALITLEDTVPTYVPEAARKAVLTVSEAKGLDFHSVCVLDAGRHIERVQRQDWRQRADSDIEDLPETPGNRPVARGRQPSGGTTDLARRRSEPTKIVRQSIAFLNGGQVESGVSSCVPAALLKTLEEDELDLEERVQRCQADARQYLQVKPEIAWSRAQQAVTLLGPLQLPGRGDGSRRRAMPLISRWRRCALPWVFATHVSLRNWADRIRSRKHAVLRLVRAVTGWSRSLTPSGEFIVWALRVVSRCWWS